MRRTHCHELPPRVELERRGILLAVTRQHRRGQRMQWAVHRAAESPPGRSPPHSTPVNSDMPCSPLSRSQFVMLIGAPTALRIVVTAALAAARQAVSSHSYTPGQVDRHNHSKYLRRPGGISGSHDRDSHDNG